MPTSSMDLAAASRDPRRRAVHLGPTEFRLLDLFLQHPGRVFSREQLLDACGARMSMSSRARSTCISAACARRSTIDGAATSSAPSARPAMPSITPAELSPLSEPGGRSYPHRTQPRSSAPK